MQYSTRNSTTLYSHFVPAIIGFVIAATVAISSDRWAAWQDAAIPATNWVDFTSIYVPNFAVGEEDKTNVVFKVERKKSIPYEYTLEAKPLVAVPPNDPNASFLCIVSGTYNSIAGETLPPEGYPLTRLFSKVTADQTVWPCKWYEADFKIELTVIFDSAYGSKTGHWQSNIFHVIPKGAQKYVKPEQVQTLEKLK